MKLAAVVRLFGRLKAYGTSEGVTKAWDTRGRSHHDPYVHGVHIGIFDRPEHPNQYAPSTTRYFKNAAPSPAEREMVNRMFKQAKPVGTRLLRLADLTPMQKTIMESWVKRMEQKRNEPGWLAEHLPTVFSHEGKNYVMDGHHRVAYDLDKGEESTLAKVFSIPNIGKA